MFILHSVFPTVPPLCLPHRWTPACVIWARCWSASQPGPVPTATNITSTSSSSVWIFFLWHLERLRGGVGERGVELYRKTNESCKKQIPFEGGLGEYLKLRRESRGTSDTRDSFFCGHYGSISEADPAHVMWESQLQITAETYHEAFGSSQPI